VSTRGGPGPATGIGRRPPLSVASDQVVGVLVRSAPAGREAGLPASNSLHRTFPDPLFTTPPIVIPAERRPTRWSTTPVDGSCGRPRSPAPFQVLADPAAGLGGRRRMSFLV